MKYGTLVIDPPWRYRKDGQDRRGKRNPGGGSLRWAEQQYRTMPITEIRDLPIGEMANKDAHLYLWTTSPRMFGERGDLSISPADLMDAWGFEYVSTLVWMKSGPMGMGNYFRIDTEFVLFGVRGHCPIPPTMRRSNVFTAPKGAHSAKPDVFYRIVETVSPAPRVDVFARKRREGWDAWGDEVPDHVQTEVFKEVRVA